MKKPQRKKNRLAVIATLLLLVAIPVGVLGTKTVNDIRNRAAEEDIDLKFGTNFSSEDINTANIGIPYEITLNLLGTYSSDAEIHFGCDKDKCGNTCPEGASDNHPEGLTIDGRTLYWSDPQMIGGKDSWEINLTASAKDDTDTYVCATEKFTFKVTEKTENTPPTCKILYSQVNLDKIPQSYRTNFMIAGTDVDDGIASAKFEILKDNNIVNTLSWNFDNLNSIVINKDSDPSLSYNFPETGTHTINASVTDASGETTKCTETEKRTVNIVIPGDNGSPEFSTDPYTQSSPGTSIDIGEQYSYTVEATDPDGDDIDYFIINETGWLNFTLNENENGELQGTFSGVPTQAGSYTGVIALNDGYHDHYSTQIWVINVNSPENDTPEVTVILPSQGQNYEQNQNLRIEWEATDSNLIERFDIFLATDPANRDTWRTIASNIGYNYNSYIWNTGSTPPGTYYIIVRATDNQTPPGVGQGISGSFTIQGEDGGGGTEPTPPDGGTEIPESYPRINNVRPKDKSKINDTKPLISADLTASEGDTIKKDSVKINLDDEDITKNAEVRGEEKEEGSVIYTPKDPLKEGSHNVTITFEDGDGQKAEKRWTFTVDTKDEDEDKDKDKDEDTINILGFKLPRRTALIIGIGIVLVLLAILIPWLFYAAWRKTSRDEEERDSFSTLGYSTEGPQPPAAPMPTSSIYPQPTTSDIVGVETSTPEEELPPAFSPEPEIEPFPSSQDTTEVAQEPIVSEPVPEETFPTEEPVPPESTSAEPQLPAFEPSSGLTETPSSSAKPTSEILEQTPSEMSANQTIPTDNTTADDTSLPPVPSQDDVIQAFQTIQPDTAPQPQSEEPQPTKPPVGLKDLPPQTGSTQEEEPPEPPMAIPPIAA